LLVDTTLGSELVNNQGKVTSTYNQQSGNVDSFMPAKLLAHKKVEDKILLSYQNLVATLDLPGKTLKTNLQKPQKSDETRASAISPNGRYVFAFDQLWDLTTQQKLDFFNTDNFRNKIFISADFSPDNHYLVIVNDLMSDSVAQIWGLQAKQLKHSWTLGGVSYAMFSPNGKQVLFNIVKFPRSNMGNHSWQFTMLPPVQIKETLNSPVL